MRLSGDRNEAVDNNRAARKGIEYARDHAVRVPLVLAARVTRTWGLFWPGQVPEGRAKWVTYAGVAVYVVLLPLAAFGLVTLRRRRVPVWAATAPLVVVTVATDVLINPNLLHQGCTYARVVVRRVLWKLSK